MSDPLLLLVWGVALAAAVVAGRRHLAPLFLSPVALVAGSLLALALAGQLFYQRVAAAPGGAGIQLIVSDDLVTMTTRLLLTATTAFVVGSALGVLPGRRGTPVAAVFGPVSLPPAAATALAVACTVPLALVLVSPGLPYLLDRALYIEDAYGGGLAGIGTQLSIAAVLGCGFLAASWQGARRAFAVGLSCVYLLVFFALATRSLALAPPLFALGAFAAAPGTRTRWGLLGSAVAAVYLLRLPLFLRGQVDHGLLAYTADLPAFVRDTSNWDVVALNVLISFGITGVTAYVQPRIPVAELLVSVNPAPGGLAGWYDIAEFHRLNAFTPYSAVGELGNVGTWAVVSYFLLVGLAMAHLDRRVADHLRRGRQAPALLTVGLVALFCLYTQQYNLRQSTRMVYYALALDLAVAVFFWLRARHTWDRGPRTGAAPARGRADRAR